MDRSEDTSGVKRKRAASNSLAGSLLEADRVVLNVIKDKKDMGIWARDVKKEAKLPGNVVTKSLKLLPSKKLIKEVANIQYKGKKHYMAVEFDPSKEILGGVCYSDGMIDKALIEYLKSIILRVICSQKVATLDGLCDLMNKRKVVKYDCYKQQVDEILNSMVLDNQIIEVKSIGLGEYNSIDVDALCYRALISNALEKGLK